MSPSKISPLFSVVLLLVLLTNSSTASSAPKKPNILVIVADDLGWTDIGAYGGEISTSNLDDIAALATKFSDFSVSHGAATQAALLTGVNNSFIGVQSNTVGERALDEYASQLDINAPTMAELLKKSGYRTYMAGKWLIAGNQGGLPSDRGFDKSYALLTANPSNHYDSLNSLTNSTPAIRYSKNGKIVTKVPRNFHGTQNFTDFILNSFRNDKRSNKPFFAYLSLTSPHLPLQVPEPWAGNYNGDYDKGYNFFRNKRIANVKRLGLYSEEHPVGDWPEGVDAWETLSAEEQQKQSRAMELYAGMIGNMDYHIGRVVDYLQDVDTLKNTIIIFLSDNGANPRLVSEYGEPPTGSRDSNFAIGPGWAAASSGPLANYKYFPTEGGIRSPLLISGPGIKKGQIYSGHAHVTDILPTILELIEIQHPYKEGGQITPMTGKSMAGILSGKEKSIRDTESFIAGQVGNGGWIRQGQYKAVHFGEPSSAEDWKLFNIIDDPGETLDLSADNTEMLNRLISAYKVFDSNRK